MCGFVCLENCGDETLAARMIAKIAHRGPDAVEVARAPGARPGAHIVMAHSRLAIIGPDNGRQPIRDGDDMLVVNGEIYNYAELRAVLGPARFRTDADSETILHLFRAGAPRWIDRLDGMFAFVLVSGGRVLAARDPLGIKPLYVARIGAGRAFASELKAFDGLDLNARAIQAIPPGALYDAAAGGGGGNSGDGDGDDGGDGGDDGLPRLRRWRRLPAGAATAEPDLDVDGLARELRLVLEAAVAKWSVADVEIGAFLSGGLDSSIIAALAQASRRRAGAAALKTFSVGAKDAPDLVAARAVAAHIGSDHHEFTFTAKDIADNLDHVLYHLESADVDLVRSAIPTLFAARLARRKVKAVLTGEGADELFAGYAYHHAYVDAPRALADELTRSLGTMHNINLQRVDRIAMAESLEARTPFLDRDLIDFAQAIPASLKLRRTDPQSAEATGPTTEKWILRKACADLLPESLVWRRKAQFDEGSGALDALQEALRLADAARVGAGAGVATAGAGADGPVDRDREGAIYLSILRGRFADPDMILRNAGAWTAARVAL